MRAAALGLGLWLGLGLVACDAGDAGPSPDEGTDEGGTPALFGGLADVARGDSPAPLDPGRDGVVAYVLEWSWEGAREEAGAWVFDTDLGYTIGIEAAYVATAMVAMVPCDAASAGASPGGELAEAVDAGGARAHDGTSDASAAVGALVEVIHDAPVALFGAGLASGDPYCGLHLLSAPLDAEAEDGAIFDDESARFVGWWSAPDDPERHVLEASINLQRGSVRTLDAWSAWPEAVEIPGFAAAALTITRYPARAFDGIEIEALSPAELAYEALGGLLQGARVEVALAQ